MKRFLQWWYTISLPGGLLETTPAERERTRYARLTSVFTLVLLIMFLLVSPISFMSTYNPSAPKLITMTLCTVLLAAFVGKLGWNIAAATLLLLAVLVEVIGTMLILPIDLTTIPVFGALVVPVILAGALMPPVAALVAGGVNSMLIVLIVTLRPHTAAYDAALHLRQFSVSVALPVAIQVVVAIVIYVIMRHLISTIRRADRAEEIIALQQAIAEVGKERAQEQRRLEEGIATIAEVHRQIANGNLDARVPLDNESVLWRVAVPLNTLLQRVQYWKWSADQSERARSMANKLVQELQQARLRQAFPIFPLQTGTWLDPLIREISHMPSRRFNTPS